MSRACKAILVAGVKHSLMIFGAGLVVISAAEFINWRYILNEAMKEGL